MDDTNLIKKVHERVKTHFPRVGNDKDIHGASAKIFVSYKRTALGMHPNYIVAEL